MSLKSILKRTLPKRFIFQLQETWSESAKTRRAQAQRFRRWMSQADSTDKNRVETRLAFDIHRLEKGLSHKQFRYGFGENVLQDLTRRMTMLEHADSRYLSNPLYCQALSAIGEYKRRHVEAGYDLSNIAKIFPENIWREADLSNTDEAGSFIMSIDEKRDNFSKGFVALAEGRYAVREYSPSPVSQELLDKVCEIAMKTPSVCNRQATRVYQIINPTTVKAALNIQGGFRGYATPPALLLVTSDIRAFMGENERNEPFVDGGLFAMSLLYALEAYRLAACPLNAMFVRSQEQQTRELLHIPDNEFLVMYIAVGNFPESVPVCRSTRRTAESIITRI